MKAIIYERYGSPDVLRLEEVDRPVLEADEVLVRVRAAAVNPYDWHFMAGLPYLSRLQFGLREPRVHRLGADLAGRVEAIGDEVTRFRPGDEIFGEVQAGGFAEYACVLERSFVTQTNREDLQLLRELIEAGEVTPVIDRTYSLGEVPEAIRYLEEGHVRGKVVISV